MNQTKLSISITLCCIATILSCCSTEEPFSIENKNSSETPSVNLGKRTPTEAIQLAIDSYNALYGEDSSSRSSKGLIDISTSPIKTISSNPTSRATIPDTCLYVVNFANDGGFAIIAADRNCDDVLAVTESGHYDPEAGTDNPGLQIFMERAVGYASEMAERNSVAASPIETLPTPQGIDLTQHKEYDDTFYTTNIPMMVRTAWGQGNGLDDDNFPEGSLFKENGLCGCATIAIAMAIAYLEYPAVIGATSDTQSFSPDWKNIKLNKAYKSETYIYPCSPGRDHPYHKQISQLCRAIGNMGNAVQHGTIGNGSTSMYTNDIITALGKLGFNVTRWTDFKQFMCPPAYANAITIVTGVSTTNPQVGHCWIIDGEKGGNIRHHYATKTGSQPWVDTILWTRPMGDMIHMNWGWYGSGNGWFSKGAASFQPKNYSESYTSLQYVIIRK